MAPRLFTVAKYEVSQYRRGYFEQFFVFASILLIFLMVSGTEEGVTLDTPSSYAIYRVGYLAGGGLDNYTHYSITMKPYTKRADAIDALKNGGIDVLAETADDIVSFKTTDSPRSQAALKRLKQVVFGEMRSRIYALADANTSLDGVLLPIKVKVTEYAIDYGSATAPSVYLNRGRFLDRGAMDNGDVGSGVNILNPDEVRRMNLTEYLSELKPAAENDSLADKSGFTLPEEWEIPFVFKSLYNNMAVVSVSILLSMLLTLSFAREKVNKTMNVLFQSPATRLDILLGKSLPYFLLMEAVNLAYSMTVSSGADTLKIFYIFTVLSATLSSFALFTVLSSRNYREVTFTSSLSLLSFLMFIVFPNVFSGINLLAFVSPLDTVTSIQNHAQVGFYDVFLSLLPYKFLCLFLFTSTAVCFSPETFQDTPGLKGLLRQYYLNLAGYMGGGVGYVVVSVSLLVPFIYIVQTLMAYLIIPLGFLAPYTSILVLAFIEELAKVLPYYYNRRMSALKYGLTAGATFFVTEKVFNIYLITKVYSYLPTPYTVFIVKGLITTLILHVAATTIFAALLSRSRNKGALYLGLILTALMHYGYNMYMISGGLVR